MRKEYRSRNETPLQRDIAKAYVASGMTQSQFVSKLPVNPRTGKPYNERTLRKWLGGERSTVNLEPALHGKGNKFVQIFRTPSGDTRSFRLRTKAGRGIVEMLTPEGQDYVRNAVAGVYNERYPGEGEEPDVDDFELLNIESADPFSTKPTYTLRY